MNVETNIEIECRFDLNEIQDIFNELEKLDDKDFPNLKNFYISLKSIIDTYDF